MDAKSNISVLLSSVRANLNNMQKNRIWLYPNGGVICCIKGRRTLA